MSRSWSKKKLDPNNYQLIYKAPPVIIKEKQGENGALSHKAGAFKEILEELKHPIRSLQFGEEFRI